MSGRTRNERWAWRAVVLAVAFFLLYNWYFFDGRSAGILRSHVFERSGTWSYLPLDILLNGFEGLATISPYILGGAVAGGAIVLLGRKIRRAAPGSARDPLIVLRNFLRRRPSVIVAPLLVALYPIWTNARTQLADLGYLREMLARAMALGSSEELKLLTAQLRYTPHPAAWQYPGLPIATVADLEHVAAVSRLRSEITFNSWFVADQVAAMLLTTLFAYGLLKLAQRSLDRLPDRAADAADPYAVPPPRALANDEVTFRAIAVTPITQGIVGIAAAATFLVLSFVASINLNVQHLGWLPPALLAYCAALGALAYWFRRASTIAVGVDGVLVHGTSRTTFHGYRDFDEVRAAGASLFLARGTKTRVRLQLHGADRSRAPLLAERIRQALLLSKSTSSAETAVGLVRVDDFRAPSLTREQLWELVENEGTQETGRVAAARALLLQPEAGDPERLRVAAERCALPATRDALATLAHDLEMVDEARVHEPRRYK